MVPIRYDTRTTWAKMVTDYYYYYYCDYDYYDYYWNRG